MKTGTTTILIGTFNYNYPGHEPEKLAAKILSHDTKDSFVAMLPIPAYMATPIKAGLRKNQNLVSVIAPAEADYVLYMNFVRGNKPHYVFTRNHPMTRDYNAIGIINRSVKTKTRY